MFGLFSKKNPDGSDRLPGPKGIPDEVGQHLVVGHNENPDWVWRLKSVVKPDGAGAKDFSQVRVFSDTMAIAAKVVIKDYMTLDVYPNLILYEGVFNKKTKTAKLERRYKKS